jgi:UDP-glucuronate 4-epimerase
MLEFARENNIRQFVFASSSSVYGINPNFPWSESDLVLDPISPYAATKVACELLGHTYSHLYNIRFISLRFFTVFGPRQRPDLAIHKFFKNILQDKPIPFFGDGSTSRDYTYIDDILKGIIAAMNYDKSNYEIINLGNNRSITLLQLLEVVENIIGKKAVLEKLPVQLGDLPHTFANIEKAKNLLGYNPSTDITTGIENFGKWYFENKI